MNLLPDETAQESYARQLAAEGKTKQEIQQLLSQRIGDQERAAFIAEKIKKEYHERNMKSGKIKIILALLLLSSSFVITCLNFHANVSFTFILYSFSITGISLLFWGAYDILH